MNESRIALLKQYLEEEPDNPFNAYALAMEYYDVDPQKSLLYLENLLQKNPDYLPTYFKAAHLLWEEEQWDRAEEVFKAGIALATEQNDSKALGELQAAYQNFQFDLD